MWARIGMVAVLAITACYAPAPSPGAPCGPGELCPVGLHCSSNVCVREDLAPDATEPDASADDGPLPRDAASLRWELIASTGQMGTTADISSTRQGNTLLVGVEMGATGSVASITDDAGNVYVRAQDSRAVNVGVNAVEAWVASDIKDGATKVSAAGSAIGSVVVWEVSNLDPQVPIVSVGTADTQAATSAPKGVEVATTARGQFVLSIILVANSVTGVVPGSDFTNDQSTFGNGWAHLSDNDAPIGHYQATWNQPNPGTSCATSVVLRVAN